MRGERYMLNTSWMSALPFNAVRHGIGLGAGRRFC
nr:hypothetical protein [uncultured bacterium]